MYIFNKHPCTSHDLTRYVLYIVHVKFTCMPRLPAVLALSLTLLWRKGGAGAEGRGCETTTAMLAPEEQKEKIDTQYNAFSGKIIK